MKGTYRIYPYDWYHTSLGELGGFRSFEWNLVEHDKGSFQLFLPPSKSPDLCPIDTQLWITRKIPGREAALLGDTFWIVKYRNVKELRDGRFMIQLGGFDAKEFLDARINAYPSASIYSVFQDVSTSYIQRQLVYMNLGAGSADPNRMVPGLTVNMNATLVGSAGDRQMAFENLLEACKSLDEESTTLSVYTSFGFIAADHESGAFAFEVKRDQWGENRGITSNSPLLFSVKRGNLLDPEFIEDFTDERNYVYGCGQTEGVLRSIVARNAVLGARAGPSSRRELFENVANCEFQFQMLGQIDALIKEKRGRRYGTGKIAQTNKCLFGLHWGWGDRVVAEIGGETMDAHILKVNGYVSEGKERINATIETDLGETL